MAPSPHRRLRVLQTHLRHGAEKEQPAPLQPEPCASLGGVVSGVAAAALLAFPGAKMLAQAVTKANAAPANLEELIATAKPTGARVAVIGIAISGVQTMKTCLAEGVEPVGFEADEDIGGLWRYKEEPQFPSVYRSTHIDSDRDLNTFGDFPWDTTRPLLIHNSELTRYLRENIDNFGLKDRIKFNARVTLVTPAGEHTPEFQLGKNKWEVHYAVTDRATGEITKHMELFDGVLACSGRHGGGGFIPQYRNQEKFKGPILHSSQYKYPEKHGMVGKRVAVVGIGNSGADIVTELGMMNGGGMRTGGGEVVNDKRSDTLLVARSGGWVGKSPHMEIVAGEMAGDAIVGDFINRQPWWVRDNGKYDKPQEQLNKHGMTPGNGHRRTQQHPIMSGIAGQVWLGDQMDDGWIKMHRGINMEKGFTEDGLGIWLNDKDGEPLPEPTPVDAVVYATGYRQQAGFVDLKVVDLRFERQGNDLPLYKGCLPVSSYKGLGFVNMIQGVTFPCAELQSRYLLMVFKGQIKVPSIEVQLKDVDDCRNTFTTQFVDRSQLRVMNGNLMGYYQDLAHHIGCYPTFWRVLTQRPTAFWHAYLVFFGAINQLTNRLVGPGRLENAEEWIETVYQSRHFGTYKEAGAGYDYNNLKGQPKNGDGNGPTNRRKKLWFWDSMKAWNKFRGRLANLKKEHPEYESCDGIPFVGQPQPTTAHLKQNLEFVKQDIAKGIMHSLEFGDEIHDGFQDKGGQLTYAWPKAAKTTAEGGLAALEDTVPSPAAPPGPGSRL